MTITRKFVIIFNIIIILAAVIHIWTYRYYFRLFPLPITLVDLIENESKYFPSYQKAVAQGKIDFPMFDLTTEEGLRKTLNSIQDLNPVLPKNELSQYEARDFENWAKKIKEYPMLCTDSSQLLILAAWSQGLQAREWHLLPPGWPPGQGHSVAEFFNPLLGKWQVVDTQHAAIIRDTSGAPLSMGDILKKYTDRTFESIVVDYGSYREEMIKGARGPTTEDYFFKQGLLKTPVLQLRQASWFAKVPKKWGISGHLIIGYPIMMGEFTQNAQVFLTKISFLAFFISFFILVYALSFRKNKK